MSSDSDKLTAFCQLGQGDYLQQLRRVERHFQYSAAFTLTCWACLVLSVYSAIPEEEMVHVDSTERFAATFAFGFLLLSMAGRFFTDLFLDDRKPWYFSGILIGSIMVQSVALMTNGIVAFGFQVPVKNDPIFGNRVHIIRWCEWTPLAFYMTFVTVGVDAPKQSENSKAVGDGLRRAYMLGASQGLSTLCALLFPFAEGTLTWSILMTVSFLLFSALFPHLYFKWDKFRQMEPGVSAHRIELYDRAKISYHLMFTCTVCWSLLVVLYFVTGFGYRFASSDSIFKSQAVTMVWQAIMDVVLKNLYLNLLVQAHHKVFNDKERSDRRLRELRRLMSAVWESSTDVICLSVRGTSGSIRTMVSSAYVRMYHEKEWNEYANSRVLLFDIDLETVKARAYEDVKAMTVQYVEFSSLTELHFEPNEDNAHGTVSNKDIDEASLSTIGTLIARSWNADQGNTSLSHQLLKTKSNGRFLTPCEANVCRLEDDAILVIVRDISERSQRFEAEKKMVLETTAREKDAEANRFTRHEVKNGLLAAIGLCESLKDSSKQEDRLPDKEERVGEDTAKFRMAEPAMGTGTLAGKPEVSRYTVELDRKLKDILDTVLSEAMARDVIHGAYEPKLERVDIMETLGIPNNSSMDNDRFPLLCDPSPLPALHFDPQLLKYIHRNAVSNACKYGQKGGIVTTMVYYDSKNEMLKLDVINLPGEGHAELVQLGEEKANIAVFSPGTRLHGSIHASTKGASHSSGDGAWIMRKCADTLKGQVAIHFEPSRTSFSLSCPAICFDKVIMTRAVDPETFQLPPNTWGVAIDDSKIQRKLLGRYFTYAGIEKARQIILGTSNDIEGFVDFMVDLVGRSPSSYFLLIVDENLDIIEHSSTKATVSGSKCIERIRHRLTPDQEQRILALVRSANDSSPDIAVYNSRAHGFICKAPIRKGGVLETILPFWEKRFLNVRLSHEASTASVLENTAEAEPCDSELATLVVKELRGNLDAIDELCSVDEDSLLMERWPQIWEKLHCLKGDLLSSLNTPAIRMAVSEINSMRGTTLPRSFLMHWQTLRSHISANLQQSSLSLSDKRRQSLPPSTDEPNSKKQKTSAPNIARSKSIGPVGVQDETCLQPAKKQRSK